MKKSLSFLLSLVMVIGIITSVPVCVSAASSGTCGDSLTWTVDDEGTLTIGGTGEMWDYDCDEGWYDEDMVFSPWRNRSFKDVVIEEGVTSLGSNAFLCCDVDSITIPVSLTSIDNSAFYYGSVKNVYITDISAWWEIDNFEYLPGEEIGATLYLNGDLLTHLTVPEDVTEIPYYGLAYCRSLKSIKIHNGVTSIGEGAFRGCTSLTAIEIPDSVVNIGYSAFRGCIKLESIVIPCSVTSIDRYAFDDCENIKYVFYGGSEADRKDISIDTSANSYLANINWHYNTTDHIYDEFVVAQSNCINYGLKYKRCSVCEYETPLESVPATGHTSSDWIIDEPATCSDKGSKHKECTICKTVLERASINKTSHTEGEWITILDSTCSSKGVRYCMCADCMGILKFEVTPETDHILSDWIVDENATVDKPGLQYKECTECGKKIETEEISQLKCSTPVLRSVENVADGIKFTWNKVTGADNYEIYRKTGSGAWKKLATVKGTVTTYTDKTAKSGTTYKYTVKAKNEAGVSKYNTTGLTIKCLTDPVLKVPTSTKKGITLKWNKVTGAEGYVVYRKAGNGKLVKLATVKGVSKISYTDKSAKKNVKYTYQIKAYSGKTYSAYSNAKTIKDKY